MQVWALTFSGEISRQKGEKQIDNGGKLGNDKGNDHLF
jgi:hypothetical protein